ncbi:MFS transporter [Propylenella binzhouense]|uniref:MFS transporter n=1 Tax=Propylenella binzhouense TaxID=2555902 RepID=A0A964T5M3_9HYPH|nr:MFS transporter [Propylenella binzhouense]MYZ48332.1 MFS transporter [Propylenella binzhouense]
MTLSQLRPAPGVAIRSLGLVVVAGCLISMLSFGPRSVMGLFLAPMTEAHDWSRETFALAIAIQNLLWGLGQPVAGALADRWGSFRVLAGGALVYAAGLAIMSWAPTPLWLHLSAGIMMGLGMAGASFSIVLAALGRRVPAEKRSIVFGIGTAAGSAGQLLFAPLGQALIIAYGWSQALVMLGAMMLIIPLLATAFAGTEAAPSGPVRQQSLKEAMLEAFGWRSYNLLVAGFFVCGFHVAFITTHLPPYIVDIGLPASVGAWAIALIGLFNIVGALASGVIAQHFPKPMLLSFIYLGRGVAITLFVLLPPSNVTVLLFAATMGLLWLSTVPPTSGLVALMFGPRYMATLMGITFFSHQVGAFLGVWLGGWLYDRTGSYDMFWWIGVALAVFAGIVHWPIRERPAPGVVPA